MRPWFPNTPWVSWIGTRGETAGERRRRMRTAGMFLEEMFETVAANPRRAHDERVCVFCRSRNAEDVGKPRSQVQMQLFPRVAELAGASVGRSVEGLRKSRADYLERVFERVNERGWDVFAGVNTFRAVDSGDGRVETGRTRGHIASVLRVQLDLDGSVAENAAAFERMREDVIDGIVPAPSFVLRSSPEKYQALWNVDGEDWTAGQAELYSHLLAARYGGDEVVTPATQVMRVPGFRNAKQEYRSESGSPVVEEVELSRRLWPVRPRAKLDVDRFRPLEGVVGVEALRRGLEKWATADRSLGVSLSKVDEASSRASEMAHENEAWRSTPADGERAGGGGPAVADAGGRCRMRRRRGSRPAGRAARWACRAEASRSSPARLPLRSLYRVGLARRVRRRMWPGRMRVRRHRRSPPRPGAAGSTAGAFRRTCRTASRAPSGCGGWGSPRAGSRRTHRRRRRRSASRPSTTSRTGAGCSRRSRTGRLPPRWPRRWRGCARRGTAPSRTRWGTPARRWGARWPIWPGGRAEARGGDPPADGAVGGDSEDWRQAALRRAGRGAVAENPPKPPASAAPAARASSGVPAAPSR